MTLPNTIGPEVAAEVFDKRFWVSFHFDSNGDSTGVDQANNLTRCISWNADMPTFSWFKFVNGTSESFRPYGEDRSVWSLKRWYQWGARNFTIQMPFGKPNLAITACSDIKGELPKIHIHKEHLSYQPDSYINARDGLTIADSSGSTTLVYHNQAMPWLIKDFESTWKALTSGKQGAMSASDWKELLEWFDPLDTIEVIAYNGFGDNNCWGRMSVMFDANYSSTLKRLKDSVRPFKNAGMKLACDAMTIGAGSVAGAYIPITEMSESAQKGFWEFFLWLKTNFRPSNMYMEAHPMRRHNLLTNVEDNNPYIGQGIGIMCEEESSYFNSTMSPNYHFYSELGNVNYLRATHWQNLHGSPAPKTARNNPMLAAARYPQFDEYATTMVPPRSDAGERRLSLTDIRVGYSNWAMGDVAATCLLDRFIQEQDPRPSYDSTKLGFIMANQMLQSLHPSYIPKGQTQFIDAFPTKKEFIQFLGSYPIGR